MTRQKRPTADGVPRRKPNRSLLNVERPDRLTKVQHELPDGRYLIAYSRRPPDA
jgi:hypothetical protein